MTACLTLNGLTITAGLLVLFLTIYACLRWREWYKESNAFSNLCSDLYNENVELQCHEPFPDMGGSSWPVTPATDWYGRQLEEPEVKDSVA